MSDRADETTLPRILARVKWHFFAEVRSKYAVVDLFFHLERSNTIEGNLEVKLLTIWANGKHEWEEAKKKRGERRSEKRKSQKKEDAGARKVER